METKIVTIDFADPRLSAADYSRFKDICNACDYARINLMSRHNIELGEPYIENGHVRVKVTSKGSTNIDNVGNRLRGISNYLLNRSGYTVFYSHHRIGNRLLNYREVDECILDKINEDELQKLINKFEEASANLMNFIREYTGKENLDG